MINKNQKKQVYNKNTISSVAIGVGAAALAGVAVAGAIILKDEKNREKAKKILTNVKNQAINYVEALKIKPNIKEENHMIRKIATDTKKAVVK